MHKILVYEIANKENMQETYCSLYLSAIYAQSNVFDTLIQLVDNVIKKKKLQENLQILNKIQQKAHKALKIY